MWRALVGDRITNTEIGTACHRQVIAVLRDALTALRRAVANMRWWEKMFDAVAQTTGT